MEIHSLPRDWRVGRRRHRHHLPLARWDVRPSTKRDLYVRTHWRGTVAGARLARCGNYALHAVVACQAAMNGRSPAVLCLVLGLALLPVARAAPLAIAQTEINY